MIEIKHKIMNAVLRTVDANTLCGANLRGADLCGANLRGANLRDAYLRGANLCDADLRSADLCGANLRGANLRDAYLCDANLRGANLRDAYLRGANLCDACLRDACLRDADLRDAYLCGADLRGADLRGANLCDAYLCDAKNVSETARLQTQIVPDTGAFEGYKKGANKHIIKLLIPADAKRSNATGRKCRASKATVLEIDGAETEISLYDKGFVYRVGETVEVADFDEHRWHERSTGIHFFITRREAELA